MEKKTSLIKRITDNIPRYKIEDLYVGEIIKIHNISYAGQAFESNSLLGYALAMQHKYTYTTIKPFAIFKHNDAWDVDYLHVGTNHMLRKIYNAKELEYAVNEKPLKEFDRAMQQYMIEHNLKRTSKLSINQIKHIEREVNIRLNPDKKQNELFYF